MARQLRIEYPGAIYHVMNRGDRREPIIRDDQDRATVAGGDGRDVEMAGQRIAHGYLDARGEPAAKREG